MTKFDENKVQLSICLEFLTVYDNELSKSFPVFLVMPQFKPITSATTSGCTKLKIVFVGTLEYFSLPLWIQGPYIYTRGVSASFK